MDEIMTANIGLIIRIVISLIFGSFLVFSDGEDKNANRTISSNESMGFKSNNSMEE